MRQTHLFWIHSSHVTVPQFHYEWGIRDSSPPTIYAPLVLVCLVCPFYNKKKTNKKTQKTVTDCTSPPIIQSLLLKTLLQCQWCTMSSVYSLYAHHSSLKHSKGLFCLFALLGPDTILFTTGNPDCACRMFYTWKPQNTKSVPFSLCPPLSILSSDSYFPSLSPFHHFFGINTHYIHCLKGYG